MPLSPQSTQRALKHTRAIQIKAFARDDGLWDIDAHRTDIKTRDTTLDSGIRSARQPVHDLWVRITLGTALNIIDAEAATNAVPYPNYCNSIDPGHKKLVGVNLLKSFHHGVNQRISGINGIHITELAAVLPTATIQAFAGYVLDTRDGVSTHEQSYKPFQLDRCHASRTDGEAVAKFFHAGRSSHWQYQNPVNFNQFIFSISV